MFINGLSPELRALRSPVAPDGRVGPIAHRVEEGAIPSQSGDLSDRTFLLSGQRHEVGHIFQVVGEVPVVDDRPVIVFPWVFGDQTDVLGIGLQALLVSRLHGRSITERSQPGGVRRTHWSSEAIDHVGVQVFLVDDQERRLGEVSLLRRPGRCQEIEVEDHGPLETRRIQLQVIVLQRRFARPDKESCAWVVGAIGLAW